MKMLLLLCWVLAYLPAAAQTRAAGPWRVVNRPIRYRPIAEWGVESAPTTQGDTATAVRVQRKLHRVPWNVPPDSITLFLNCQNPLLAPVVRRSQPASVHFKATGATVRLDAKQHLLLLTPSAPVVVLWAYRGQKLVFRHDFKAVRPPLPTVECFASSCGATCKPAGYNEFLRTVTLRALPAIDFGEILPDDARYRIARFRATLLRQGKVVELTLGQLAERTIQGPQGDMSDLTSNSQPGDQLQVDVLLVQRHNSLDIITEVPVTQQFIVNDIRCPAPE